MPSPAIARYDGSALCEGCQSRCREGISLPRSGSDAEAESFDPGQRGNAAGRAASPTCARRAQEQNGCRSLGVNVCSRDPYWPPSAHMRARTVGSQLSQKWPTAAPDWRTKPGNMGLNAGEFDRRKLALRKLDLVLFLGNSGVMAEGNSLLRLLTSTTRSSRRPDLPPAGSVTCTRGQTARTDPSRS
jgi:hypothetical protein